LIAALSAAKAEGVKIALIVQFAPGWTWPPHVVDSEKAEAFVPLNIIEDSERVFWPVFVNITFCTTLALPTATLPNDIFVALSVTCGASCRFNLTVSNSELDWLPAFAADKPIVMRANVRRAFCTLECDSHLNSCNILVVVAR